MAETVLVLSDVHANARAFRRAVEIGRERGADRWIVLGDLLTYGCDAEEVLEITDELHRDGAIVVRGNHDQLYFDLAEGRGEYRERLPEWLRESVDYTARKVDLAAFARRYEWCDEHVIEDVLVSHANPFGKSDWRYVNDANQFRSALAQVGARGYRIGVFGHVHRARMFIAGDGDVRAVTGTVAAPVRAVLTVGSVGQPRDADATSSLLRIRIDARACEVEVVPIDYDVGAHIAAIQRSGMSGSTCQELCKFFTSRAE